MKSEWLVKMCCDEINWLSETKTTYTGSINVCIVVNCIKIFQLHRFDSQKTCRKGPVFDQQLIDLLLDVVSVEILYL